MCDASSRSSDVDDDEVEEERFVFDDADWLFYQAILDQVGERRIFVTFDGERLEVMSPSWDHKRLAYRLDRLLWLLMVELDIPFESLGSFTVKSRKANRGLEADRWFYTRNAEAIVGKDEISLPKDPPDLAIEIEVSRRLLDRIEVYRRLGVPEVWCYNGKRLRVLRLRKSDGYKEVRKSPTFPNLPLVDVHRLVELKSAMDELEWTDAVRTWVRQHLLPQSSR
jgi:Uma2 family endonuclease